MVQLSVGPSVTPHVPPAPGYPAALYWNAPPSALGASAVAARPPVLVSTSARSEVDPAAWVPKSYVGSSENTSTAGATAPPVRARAAACACRPSVYPTLS